MRRFFPFLLLLPACYGQIEGSDTPSEKPAQTSRPPAPGQFTVARVWIQDQIDLDKLVLRRGCDLWVAKGVQCLLVPKDEADLRVTADERPCEADENGKYPPSAHAFPDGSIVYFTRCIGRKDGRIEDGVLAAIMAHEVGHQLGIWAHVPPDCDGKEQVAPSGIHLCGRAVMNSFVGDRQLTALDLLAYDLRTDTTVLKGDVTTTRQALTAEDRPICEIRLPLGQP